jgi:hypothetical protein
MLPPVRIASTPLRSDAPQAARPKDQPFNLKDGGTFIKREGPTFTTELKFPFQHVPAREQGVVQRISGLEFQR